MSLPLKPTIYRNVNEIHVSDDAQAYNCASFYSVYRDVILYLFSSFLPESYRSMAIKKQPSSCLCKCQTVHFVMLDWHRTVDVHLHIPSHTPTDIHLDMQEVECGDESNVLRQIASLYVDDRAASQPENGVAISVAEPACSLSLRFLVMQCR